jgi:mRNA interferase RelE/StbE
MSRAVRPALQVVDFARRLAPEPRRAIKRALQDLRQEKGDICALEAALAGYYRLRVGRHRMIFSYGPDGAIEVVFIEDRSVVYEVFENEFIRRLNGQKSD